MTLYIFYINTLLKIKMINNNPYNIPEKKVLSQSKILSQTNSSRNSSTYLHNRNSNQIMYSSGIFMKNSTPMNPQFDNNFYQPAKQVLSPLNKFHKNSNVQFVTSQNVFRPPENYIIPPTIPKQNNIQKALVQLKEKIEIVQKRLAVQQEKQSLPKQIQNKKLPINSEYESFDTNFQENLKKNIEFIDLINSLVKKSIQSQNNRTNYQFQSTTQNNQNTKKLDQSLLSRVVFLQQSFSKYENEKNIEQQMQTRIKSIQKTIRQMGEDIHLVNDKEEILSQKIAKQFSLIQNEIKNIKIIEKKVSELQKVNDKNNEQINSMIKKMNVFQCRIDLNLTTKIKQIELNIEKLRNSHKDIKPSYQKRYFSQPIVLKYLQKFQVLNYFSSQKCQEILINQITYFVDNQGYILDNDRFYLINGNSNQRIKLQAKHIDILKKNKVLI